MSSGFNKDDLYLKTTQEKIQQKIVHAPGTFFEYNNDVTDLLSPILMKATNTSVLDFAQRELFTPLGISNAIWELPLSPPFDREPYYRASQGIHMLPRDMAKLGFLFLNHGRWARKQIVPVDFVLAATQKQITAYPDSDYGYLWWLKPLGGKNCYFAFGRDGQYICVFHDLDMVVVITSAREETINMNLDIIGRFIIPAVRR
jgi:CubicO group peptidase (beta-lactamase class C family)